MAGMTTREAADFMEILGRLNPEVQERLSMQYSSNYDAVGLLAIENPVLYSRVRNVMREEGSLAPVARSGRPREYGLSGIQREGSASRRPSTIPSVRRATEAEETASETGYGRTDWWS